MRPTPVKSYSPARRHEHQPAQVREVKPGLVRVADAFAAAIRNSRTQRN